MLTIVFKNYLKTYVYEHPRGVAGLDFWCRPMARCRRCGLLFANALQLGAHNRVCEEYIRVCEDLVSAGGSGSDSDGTRGSNSDSDSNSAVGSHSDAAPQQAVVVTQPAPLHTLARRSPRPWGVVHTLATLVVPTPGGHARARDYRELQEFWLQQANSTIRCPTFHPNVESKGSIMTTYPIYPLN